MLKPAKSAVVVVITALLVTTSGWLAHADGMGRVDCTRGRQVPECDVEVTVPGTPASGGSRSAGPGDDAGCGWVRVVPQPAAPVPGATGAWYAQRCVSADGRQGFGSAPVWVADVPAAAAVARSARARLRLPTPVIRLNPDGVRADVLVTVPVWLWTDAASWGSRSATASVPGMSVTATATAVRVLWRLGDGASVTCGQGTPWVAGTDPWTPSPTCGHVYHRPGTVTVTATVTWNVTWRGGGVSGTVPALTTQAQATIRVVEAPAVNSGRG